MAENRKFQLISRWLLAVRRWLMAGKFEFERYEVLRTLDYTLPTSPVSPASSSLPTKKSLP